MYQKCNDTIYRQWTEPVGVHTVFRILKGANIASLDSSFVTQPFSLNFQQISTQETVTKLGLRS